MGYLAGFLVTLLGLIGLVLGSGATDLGLALPAGDVSVKLAGVAPHVDVAVWLVDRDGRLWVATRMGLQVCDQAGRVNCIIPPPAGRVTRLCFAGSGFDNVVVSCGDKLYARKTKVRGMEPFDSAVTPAKPRPQAPCRAPNCGTCSATPTTTRRRSSSCQPSNENPLGWLRSQPSGVFTRSTIPSAASPPRPP